MDTDALVDVDRITRDLVAMVQCESVNPFAGETRPGHREHEFAELYADMMRSVGLEVESHEVRPGRSNVWGRLRGTGGGPTVLLAGHIDTVGVEGYDQPFSAHIESGRLYGRGSCDMKAALAAYLEAVRVLQQSGVQLAGDVLVAGICDEEHTMLGSADMGARGPRADVAIIGEPTDLAVCSAHRGQICLVITTYGTAVHSSRPDLGNNAITHMAKVIGALATYADELRLGPSHPLCGVATTNPGVITGGSIASTVPDICQLEIDRRTLPGQTLADVVGELKMLLDQLADADTSFQYSISEPTIMSQPLDTPVDHELVLAMLNEVRSVTGRDVQPEAFTAATDAPNFAVPAVICGPGSLINAHTLHEFVELGEVSDAARIYARVIRTLAG
jgi:acetylornithine deacetylase/succinyl-diaminopimelate desuccinylase family protein